MPSGATRTAPGGKAGMVSGHSNSSSGMGGAPPPAPRRSDIDRCPLLFVSCSMMPVPSCSAQASRSLPEMRTGVQSTAAPFVTAPLVATQSSR